MTRNAVIAVFAKASALEIVTLRTTLLSQHLSATEQILRYPAPDQL